MLHRFLNASIPFENEVPKYKKLWAPLVLNPLGPPLVHREPETRSLMGPFFFWFQRGLAMPSDFQRLAFPPKSVSERPASLSIRPSWKARRIQKVTHFQYVGEIELRRS